MQLKKKQLVFCENLLKNGVIYKKKKKFQTTKSEKKSINQMKSEAMTFLLLNKNEYLFLSRSLSNYNPFLLILK